MTKPAYRAPERAPAFAHLAEEQSRALRHRREHLVEMLGVMTVGVSSDNRDRPVVVRMELFGRELFDLLEDPRMRRIELADDLPSIPAAGARDDRSVELVGVVAAGAWLTAVLAKVAEPGRSVVLPRGGVRDEILVRPAG